MARKNNHRRNNRTRAADIVTLGLGGLAAGIVLNELINLTLKNRLDFGTVSLIGIAAGSGAAVVGALSPRPVMNVLVPAGVAVAGTSALVRYNVLPLVK